MKVIAVLQVDLEVTPLGTRSRLADDLAGAPVLRRTIERVRRAQRIGDVYLLCPAGQYERCLALVEDTGVIVRRHDTASAPWEALVRTARKWSLDGWRGGIGQTTSFDEYADCGLLAGLLGTIEADAVLSVPPASPLFDADLADRMVDHKEKKEEDTRLVFTQTPPGLAGILMDAGLVRELAEKNTPIGWTFSYQPDNPRKDLIFESCCLEVPAELRFASGRLVADTDRSIQRIADLLATHDCPDSITIGRWLAAREAAAAEPLPREVEIELTTDDAYPDALLRPRGGRVPPRGPIDPDIVEKVVGPLGRYDDALVVLGGFGDPLRHPRFAEVIERIRASGPDGRGVYGLAVRTTGVELSDERIDAMISHGVDVLLVTLDAWTPELYGRLQSPDAPAAAHLDAVLGRLDRLAELCRERVSVKPILVPEMTKARENVHELDDFYDGWLRRNGAVTISGYSHRAGQCEDRSVIRMAPAARIGCRRIRSRCLVLADGGVAMCDQDLRGHCAVGSLTERSFEQIWRSAAFERVREAHRAGLFDSTPLCASCEDWHRP